jgi:GxxExxY protein
VELNDITYKIIQCCIEVHKNLGPGLLESVYEAALCIEMDLFGMKYERQKVLPVVYKDKLIGKFFIDILVENHVVLELKSVEKHNPIYEAQVLNYLKLGNYKLGLLINFNSYLLRYGIKRIIL